MMKNQNFLISVGITIMVILATKPMDGVLHAMIHERGILSYAVLFFGIAPMVSLVQCIRKRSTPAGWRKQFLRSTTMPVLIGLLVLAWGQLSHTMSKKGLESGEIEQAIERGDIEMTLEEAEALIREAARASWDPLILGCFLATLNLMVFQLSETVRSREDRSD